MHKLRFFAFFGPGGDPLALAALPTLLIRL